MYSKCVSLRRLQREPMPGLEPGTSSLPRKCSTAELHRHLIVVMRLNIYTLREWAVMDSNHRRRKPAELQSAPFGHSGNCPSVCSASSLITITPLSGKDDPHSLVNTPIHRRAFKNRRQRYTQNQKSPNFWQKILLFRLRPCENHRYLRRLMKPLMARIFPREISSMMTKPSPRAENILLGAARPSNLGRYRPRTTKRAMAAKK